MCFLIFRKSQRIENNSSILTIFKHTKTVFDNKISFDSFDSFLETISQNRLETRKPPRGKQRYRTSGTADTYERLTINRREVLEVCMLLPPMLCSNVYEVLAVTIFVTRKNNARNKIQQHQTSIKSC